MHVIMTSLIQSYRNVLSFEPIVARVGLFSFLLHVCIVCYFVPDEWMTDLFRPYKTPIQSFSASILLQTKITCYCIKHYFLYTGRSFNIAMQRCRLLIALNHWLGKTFKRWRESIGTQCKCEPSTGCR